MNISLVCNVDAFTGYGLHAIQLVKHLPKFGVDVQVRPIHMREAFGAKIPDEMVSAISRRSQNYDIELILSIPTITPTPGKRCIYFSMCESTRLPSSAVHNLNRADIVVVPSQWCATVFSANGVTRPIVVIPLGFSEEWTPRRVVEKDPNNFTFACGGRLMNGPERKGINVITHCFKQVFSHGEDVKLKVKLFPDCPMFEEQDERISVTRAYMPETDLFSWMQSSDCFINVATGGFEMFPLQAMIAGVPVISHVFGGVSEYLNPNNSIIVSHSLVPAGDTWKGLGIWGQADAPSLCEAMRWATENDTQLGDIRMDAKESVRHLTWKRHCKLLSGVIDGLHGTMRKRKQRCVVQLGRNGDIINILPAVRRMAEEQGGPVAMVTASEYINVIKGLSYVEPIEWKSSFDDLLPAIKFAKENFDDVVVTQVHGAGYHFRPVTPNFNVESWSRTSMSHLFDSLPLVFDNRDFGYEVVLAAKYLNREKPNVLVNLSGNSTPFEEAPKSFMVYLRRSLPNANVVDLSTITTPQIYDLLGLYDRSVCLITTDTATMHLARGSSIPMIALCGTGWHATKPSGNVILKFNGYENAWRGINRIISAAADCVRENAVHPRLINLRQNYTPKNELTRLREERAASTWRLADVVTVDFDPGEFLNAKSVGDPSNSPCIKEVIDCFTGKFPYDIIMLANNDIAVLPGFEHEVRRAVNRYGCYFSHRIDIDKPVIWPLIRSTLDGKVYPGADLFAFKSEWWLKWRYMVAPMFMSFEGWDGVLKAVMIRSGFKRGQPYIVHESHPESNWKLQPDRPGQAYNRASARQWAKEHGFEKYLLKGSDFLFGEI